MKGLVSVLAIVLWTSACIGPPPTAPSPIIEPDAVEIRVGDAQTFTVLNAAVRQFSLVDMRRDVPGCAAIDESSQRSDSVRVAGVRPCDGVVYLTADLGSGHTPLVAVVTVR